jgi:hypothetical protein
VAQLEQQLAAAARDSSGPACISRSGSTIGKPLLVLSAGAHRLRYSAQRDATSAEALVQEAAARAATMNAAGSSAAAAAGYAMSKMVQVAEPLDGGTTDVAAEVLMCSAALLPKVRRWQGACLLNPLLCALPC